MNPNRPEADRADYDTNPDRFRTGSEAPRKYGQGDVHESVAERIVSEHSYVCPRDVPPGFRVSNGVNPRAAPYCRAI